MEHKAFDAVNVKQADAGVATAIFSRFGGPPDADNDITEPGAFTPGVVVPISSFNHGSWGSSLPVGKATIRVRADRAEADLEFFMDTTGGRETFATVKQLGPCMQYSYGYDVDKAAPGEWEGRPVRILQKLKVHEVSPVLLGAGRDTMTVAGSVKSADEDGVPAALMAEVRAIGNRIRAAEEKARADVLEIARNFHRNVELCAIAEQVATSIRKDAALLRYSEARPPGNGRVHAAWATLIECCEELRVDLPMLRWFAPETAQQAAYAKRWTRDWLGFSTERPVRGLWDGTATVWVANNLSRRLTLATVAHEAAHVAGGDEPAAREYEARSDRRWS